MSDSDHLQGHNKVNQRQQDIQSDRSLVNQKQHIKILTAKRSDRWDVYRRLQSLDIDDCQCSTNQPLLAHLYSPTITLQVWSVVRQFSLSRSELIDWLDSCWQVRYDHQSR